MFQMVIDVEECDINFLSLYILCTYLVFARLYDESPQEMPSHLTQHGLFLSSSSSPDV